MYCVNTKGQIYKKAIDKKLLQEKENDTPSFKLVLEDILHDTLGATHSVPIRLSSFDKPQSLES